MGLFWNELWLDRHHHAFSYVKWSYLMAMFRLLLWDAWSESLLHAQAKYLGRGNTCGWTAGQWYVVLFSPRMCNYSQGSPSIAGSLGLQGMSIQTNDSILQWCFWHSFAKDLSFCCCLCCFKTYYSWDSRIFTIMILIKAIIWGCSDVWNFRLLKFLFLGISAFMVRTLGIVSLQTIISSGLS